MTMHEAFEQYQARRDAELAAAEERAHCVRRQAELYAGMDEMAAYASETKYQPAQKSAE